MEGNTIVDITGLAKPTLFQAIRGQLISQGRVTICHCSARSYYPLMSDLEPLFAAESGDNKLEILARLGEVLKGEQGPYKPIRLLSPPL